MSNPVIITVQAQTAEAAAALKAFATQGTQNLQVLTSSTAALGKGAQEAAGHIAGMSYYFRSGMDAIRLAAMGGGDRAAFYAIDELTRALVAGGAAMSTLLPIGVGLAAAIGGGVYAWREWTAGEREAAAEAKNLAEAWKALPALIQQIQDMQQTGLLGPGAAGEYADYLTGRKKLYRNFDGQITPNPISTPDESEVQGRIQYAKQMGVDSPEIEANIRNTLSRTTALDPTKDQAAIQKWVQDQMTAGGQVTKQQLDALKALREEIRKANEESLSGIEKQKAEITDRYEKEREEIQKNLTLGAGQLGPVNFGASREVIEAQAAMALTYKDEQQDIAALEEKNDQERLDKASELYKKYQEFFNTIGKAEDDLSHAMAAADRERLEALRKQMEMQQQITRDNLEGQLKGIEGNPLLSESEKAAESIPVLQQLMAANRDGIAQMQSAQGQLNNTTDAYWELQKKIADMLREQAELQNQLAKSSPYAKVEEQFAAMAGYAQSWQNVMANVGQVGLNAIQAGMNSVASNMTKVIEGTETWRKALLNIAESAITQLLEGLITVIEKLLLELAIDIAIKAVTGGAFAEGGRPDVGKVALVGERGPELWVPDSAGTIISNSQTERLLQGRGDEGGFNHNTTVQGHRVSVYNIRDRHEMLDAMKSSDGGDIIINHVRNNRQRIGIST